jgi:Uma2 family endonuclease
MAAGTLVSVAEYLSTSYRPDREYIDGVVLERDLGEDDQSGLQGALTVYLSVRQREWGTRVRPEQRVQVSMTRFRVPDICVILNPGPREPIITKPPFICIEILSKKDTAESMQERIDDYLAFGVPYVWVVNPRTRRAFVHTIDGSHEAKDGILRTANPEFLVPLPEVFDYIE